MLVEMAGAHCYTKPMGERIEIGRLMQESGVKFGTSGARGLVTAMSDRVCFAYTAAFLQHLERNRGLGAQSTVYVAGDRRPSSPRIMEAVARAVRARGHQVENCGLVPSPAVALRGFEQRGPSIMVTGSHIPDDRNGIKFNTSQGEIDKLDEEAMLGVELSLPDLFDEQGMFREHTARLGPVRPDALTAYRARYETSFPTHCLRGLRLGVYGHSAVGRELMVELYQAMGAEVLRLGFSEAFVPVDTEAIRDQDVAQARAWAPQHGLDAIVSTDGDSDRPLVADERGHFIRGDITGIITAQYLGASAVAAPVSCNTGLEWCGSFAHVERTRIGSPFVIAGMKEAARLGHEAVVGYEANGGFLSWHDLKLPTGGVLAALPTRDAIVVHLCVLLSGLRAGKPLSELAGEVAPRVTASDRDPSFSLERSAKLLIFLRESPLSQLAQLFGVAALTGRDTTDGVRLTIEGGDIVHLRPSGNAPELRCYAEADTEPRANELVRHGLGVARAWAASA